MQRRGEFSFPAGSPARGQLLPPRPPPAAAAQRFAEDEEEVRWLQASRQASPDYSSGTPSPQLWAYNHHNPHHQQLHRPYPASAGSSPSRAQAIAGFRREMLDLVRGLPESAYELSLRDIVDRPAAAAVASSSSSSPPPRPPPPPAQPSIAAAEAAKKDEPDATAVEAEAQVEEGKKQGGSGGKKQGRKQRGMMRKQRSRSLERSVSLDTGLLIKLFLPLSMGGKKKVSPRPDATKDGKKKKKKQGKKEKQGKQPEAATPAQEEEWWSKSEFSEAGGSSRTSSTGSSSTSSGGSVRNGHVNGGVNPRAPARSWSRKRTGCYAFFRANKSKNGVGQD
ncbi:unnamed protein product [Urochloa decumbens]|uniref:Uncharacterized protein n=1 Tax=Urochloa decumbens TaxID=240449 RepID=A0ABC9AS92_9POAL